jgi:hypothetical protein
MKVEFANVPWELGVLRLIKFQLLVAVRFFGPL